MKTAWLPTVLATSSLLSTTSASLLLPIVKNREVEARQLRRRGTVTEQLGNAQSLGLYYANVSVGTPPQQLAIQIDTGSSDVWIASSYASLCRIQRGCDGGSCKLCPEEQVNGGPD